MLMVSHLRRSLVPARCLVPAAHHHINSPSLFRERDKDTLLDEKVEIVIHQQSNKLPWKCLELKSSLAQGSETSPTYNWLPQHITKARFLDGLLGNGRQEITCLKRRLLTWPHICPCNSQLSIGYCTVPPEFAYPLPSTRLGHTYSMDLSPSDQDKLKKLAYQELKTVLKKSNIKYKKAPKAKPVSAPNMLDEVAAHDIKAGKITPDLQVPKTLKMLLHHICEHTDTQHIFKTDSEASKVKSLVNEIEENSKDPNFSIPDTYSTQDIASAVKTLLNVFPVRLMTTEKVDEYPDMSIAFEVNQRKALNLFILSMSQPHRDTLHLLMRTLHMVDKNQGKSKMNADTLAPIFGPILFKMPDKLSQQEQEAKLTQFSDLTKMLIRFNKRHFYVEQDLLAQLRASSGKEKFSFKLPWTKASKKSGDVKVPEIDQIKVTAPSMPQTSLDIKITQKTLAYEVVDAYRDICKKDGSIPNTSWKNCLFEVGGNIGERCLDPITFIMDVYQANPEAQFVIRPSTLKGYSAFHLF
ncbi:unnamed protein product [Lymnaea stagnalis]|uniref:Rho-GAP domain-containing protein n=1 Tax=Lymnaea stagnalis TaxID=6523 RepID=A0AAV2IDX1_LYMST